MSKPDNDISRDRGEEEVAIGIDDDAYVYTMDIRAEEEFRRVYKYA